MVWPSVDRNPTVAMASAQNQSENVDLFDEYFRRADLDRNGRISGNEAVAFFQGSGLPKQVLAKIRQPMNSKMNKGHKFLFFLLPRLFTTCLSSFCGSNSRRKRKKITSRSNRVSSIGCLDKLFSSALKTSVDSWLQRVSSLFFLSSSLLLQLMPIYRHHRRVLELVTWGEDGGHDFLPLSLNLS